MSSTRAEGEAGEPTPAEEQSDWLRFPGVVESGDANSSQAIDEWVYSSND